MGSSASWGADQERKEREGRIRRANIVRRNTLLGKLTECDDINRLQLLEDIMRLSDCDVERVRTLVRNQEAIAEVARVFRMFKQGSFG